MLEVGKVVTNREETFYHRPVGMMLFERDDDVPHPSPPTYIDKEWATVKVGLEGVALSLQAARTGELRMTPEQAIELAQMLMKTAESQTEYAKAREELQVEMTKLDETFKDRISGLGIGGIEEPQAPAPVRHDGEVIIVDAG